MLSLKTCTTILEDSNEIAISIKQSPQVHVHLSYSLCDCSGSHQHDYTVFYFPKINIEVKYSLIFSTFTSSSSQEWRYYAWWRQKCLKLRHSKHCRRVDPWDSMPGGTTQDCPGYPRILSILGSMGLHAWWECPGYCKSHPLDTSGSYNHTFDWR